MQRIAPAALAAALMLVSCRSSVGPEAADRAQSRSEETGGDPADTEAARLMYILSELGVSGAPGAAQKVITADDARFIAIFIELLRAHQIGIVPADIDPKSGLDEVIALEKLSGERFGSDWQAWVEWYGGTELAPPPGFLRWKGELLARIDPGFGEFLTGSVAPGFRVEEIAWGGVGVDGIPALDNAPMVRPQEADYITEAEPVFGLVINGDARAYPQRILDWHEMANDVVGGVPVSLAYCTLCGTGIAFDGRSPGGRTLTFGSSGLLYRSNKLMYDRDTRSLWNQFTGEPVVGELAGKDIILDRFPLVVTSWGDWLAQHPDTTVLDIDTGYERPYTLGAAYGDYFGSPDTMFPVWQRSKVLPAKSRVFGLSLQGSAVAFPLHALVRAKVVNARVGRTRVGGVPIVLIATRGTIDVAARNRPKDQGDAFYEAGGEVRAFARGDLRFRTGPAPDVAIDSQGRTWKVTEGALRGPGGRRAARIVGQLSYWFAWFSFFPQTTIYGSRGRARQP